ncbi:MAG: GNAT family N-acetyltransferase [Deltaproteobacteria bacterium]|nr:GNAT family N-acetyltransferase [Deltaproteobacteria bacterium]
MRIREANKKDYNQIMALYQQLQPEDPVVEECKGKSVFESLIKSNNNIIIVAEIEDTIVSSCYLNLIPNLTRNAKPYAVIENVITEMNHRNKGIGKKVLEYALNKAWQSGCYKVMLLTGKKDESTLNFYKACGLESGIKTAFIAKKL